MSQLISIDFSEAGRQVEQHRRRMRWMLIPVLLLVIFFIVSLAAAGLYFDLPNDPPGELTTKRFFVFSGWLLSSAATFSIICWLTPTPPKLTCPHCGTEGHDWSIVLATGHCPKCLNAMFATTSATSKPIDDTTTLLTRAEFQRKRSLIKSGHPLLILMIGLCAIVAGFKLAGELDGNSLQNSDDYRFPIYQVATTMAIAIIVFGRFRQDLRARSAKLGECSCHHCDQALGEGPVTLITGRCTECGSQVLSDPMQRPPCPVSGQPLTVAWFRSRAQFWRNYGWVPCILGSVPAVLLIAGLMSFGKLRETEPTPAGVALFFGTMTMQLVGIGICHWCLRKLASLNCPNCQQDLSGVSQLVMASRNCTHCATTILCD